MKTSKEGRHNMEANNNLFECYVFECAKCGERVFINKKNNIMNLFINPCKKCNSNGNRYYFLGEANCGSYQIHRPIAINRSDIAGYIESHIKRGC